MNQDYLKSWTGMSSDMQKPFHAMLELNVRTLKNLKFMRTEELSDIHHPEELLSKQVNLVMENSHSVLDYMQKSFQILEGLFVGLSQGLQTSADMSIKQAREDFLKNKTLIAQEMQKNLVSGKSLAQKVVKSAANTGTQTKKSLSTSRKKPSTSRLKSTKLKSKSAGSSSKATSLKSKPSTSGLKASSLKSKAGASKAKSTGLKSKLAVSGSKDTSLKSKSKTTRSKPIGAKKQATTSKTRAASSGSRSLSSSRGVSSEKIMLAGNKKSNPGHKSNSSMHKNPASMHKTEQGGQHLNK